MNRHSSRSHAVFIVTVTNRATRWYLDRLSTLWIFLWIDGQFLQLLILFTQQKWQHSFRGRLGEADGTKILDRSVPPGCNEWPQGDMNWWCPVIILIQINCYWYWSFSAIQSSKSLGYRTGIARVQSSTLSTSPTFRMLLFNSSFINIA